MDTDLKALKSSRKSIPEYSLQMIAKGAYQNKTGIFEWPLAQNILQNLFDDFITGRRPLKLGPFQDFFN